MNKLTSTQRRMATLVFVLATLGITYGITQISYAILFIIAIPAVFGYLFWYFTYLRKPTSPDVILPIFMITVAGFDFHLIEEYIGKYSLAISRIFNFAWTADGLSLTIFILSGALMLVCVGLYYKHPIAGFIAIIFLVTRFAEIALFIFPFVRPAFQPDNIHAISEYINGTLVSDMPSYYYFATKNYYFPGMFTVVLAIVPAGIAIYRMWKYHKSE